MMEALCWIAAFIGWTVLALFSLCAAVLALACLCAWLRWRR